MVNTQVIFDAIRKRQDGNTTSPAEDALFLTCMELCIAIEELEKEVTLLKR